MSIQSTDPTSLWERAQQAGINRRRFIQLMAFGGAAAVLVACESAIPSPSASRAVTSASAAASGAASASAAPSASEAPAAMFVKSEEPFLKVFDTELGTPWWQQTSFVTPYEHFYVRNRYATPVVDASTWELRVHGDAVSEELTLTYDELIALPSVNAPRVMECFGNGRTVNREQLGHDVQGGNWVFSDVSQGEWTYVPIQVILDRVRPTSDAAQLLFWSGVDGPDTGRPMDMSEVTARADVIGLAYKLNGVDLPPDHGGPVRAIVPGWGGAASVKWLTEIQISSHGFWTRMHTREEAYIGDDFPAEEPGPDDEFLGAVAEDIRGQTGKELFVKSWLAIPYVIRNSEPPGNYPLEVGEVPRLAQGAQMIRGYANAPMSGIDTVEYSIDDGDWQTATLVPPFDLPYSWVRFEFEWDAPAGTHNLRTRATDTEANVQPETVVFNELGINCNAIARFEVEVA